MRDFPTTDQGAFLVWGGGVIRASGSAARAASGHRCRAPRRRSRRAGCTPIRRAPRAGTRQRRLDQLGSQPSAISPHRHRDVPGRARRARRRQQRRNQRHRARDTRTRTTPASASSTTGARAWARSGSTCAASTVPGHWLLSPLRPRVDAPGTGRNYARICTRTFAVRGRLRSDPDYQYTKQHRRAQHDRASPQRLSRNDAGHHDGTDVIMLSTYGNPARCPRAGIRSSTWTSASVSTSMPGPLRHGGRHLLHAVGVPRRSTRRVPVRQRVAYLRIRNPAMPEVGPAGSTTALARQTP